MIPTVGVGQPVARQEDVDLPDISTSSTVSSDPLDRAKISRESWLICSALCSGSGRLCGMGRSATPSVGHEGKDI